METTFERRTYRVAEVAATTGLTPDYLYKCIRAGAIKAVKVRSVVLIPAEELTRIVSGGVSQ